MAEVDEAPAWETCKENAQPLRRGRKVEALNAGLEAGAAKVSEVQKQERETWEARLVAEATGGDPLDRVRDAEPIFDYLYARHIGQLHALFWISWAAVLESKRKLDEADKVLTRGELMRAQPAGRIKQKHAEFEARLMRKHILAPPEDAVEAMSNGGGASSSRPSKERSALNRMSKREAAGPHRPTTQRAPAPLSRAPPSRPAAAAVGGRGGNGFLIFEDENQAPGTRELEDAPEPWEMGTATDNAKENTGEATPWAGAT
ncbi:mitotic checkpoint serine threonine-protein kinase bub1 beta [Chrysochromulina tobinii]|uniref:Mitotic checkpoint serine threonine-protein kinase bub1 beta n=1 Tax=Chrysochromulina tobinii TaxID=1460289 RepID=A0A0M0JW58_9EUKA|nr:mitotic checkpoint serine threonine-protein kinase bub1 beta [Chrysochromulina tobinii]|eukprot:KOO30814.1 mitotic checkpoint serine threonine-protein kinase bub1 beta [Chrysochromulina sp. CCMP291]